METGFVKYRRSAAKMSSAALFLMLLLCVHFPAFAEEKAPVARPSVYTSPVFIALLCIIIVLLIAILIFADLAKAAIKNKMEQEKKAGNAAGAIKTLIWVIAVGSMFTPLTAQATSPISPVAPESVQSDYWGMNATTFYAMLSFIAFELLVAWKFYTIAMQQLGAAERKKLAAAAKAKIKATVKRPSMLDKLNASVAIEKEDAIMLDHDYDGIKELDNNLPPWWKYGFYLTIVFAVVYLFHFHVSHTGKLQLAEYEEQLVQAKHEMEEYRKQAANLVDENNAVMLTDNASLASGKAIFTTNCVACHGAAGEGGVGPNLTDDYWLHQGDIKDVFKTIKYGYPEKGMKSWQQDLGAKQIHEVASFVKSLYGTNPPNAKEKEGELYKEKAAVETKAVAVLNNK